MRHSIDSIKSLRYCLTLAFAVFTVFLPDAIYATVREKCVDPQPRHVRGLESGADEACFSGHPCVIGIRGDWLDLTNRVTRVRGANANFSILRTGTERNPSVSGCLPEGNADREGFVMIRLTGISRDSSGDTEEIRIKLSRPGGEDRITVKVLRGKKYLNNDEPFTARANEPVTIEFTGGRLNQLRLRDDALPGERIISRSASRATVRLIFTERGEHTANEKLRFTGWEPPLNQLGGYPKITVVRPAAAAIPNKTFTTATTGNGRGSVVSIPASISCPTNLLNDIRYKHKRNSLLHPTRRQNL